MLKLCPIKNTLSFNRSIDTLLITCLSYIQPNMVLRWLWKDSDWLHLAECRYTVQYGDLRLCFTHTFCSSCRVSEHSGSSTSSAQCLLHIKQYNIFSFLSVLKIFSLFSLTEDWLSGVHTHKIQKKKEKKKRRSILVNLTSLHNLIQLMSSHRDHYDYAK